MAVVGAIMVPHPPLIVPEVGRGGEQQIYETTAAYRKAAKFVKELMPDTIVLSSPHNVMYYDYFNISGGKTAHGDFRRFGAKDVAFDVEYDVPLVQEISRLADEDGLPAGTLGTRDPALDHGTMVPLYFLQQKLSEFRLVRMGLSGLSLEDHYRLGMLVRQAAENLDRRVVFVGSGDLSHKLKDDGPYGFDAAGPVYDDRIMDVMGRAAFGELFDFDATFCDQAAECGHRSFCILAGALDRKSVDAERLAHQDVTGVGYGVCTFRVTGDDDSRDFLAQRDAANQKRLAEERANEDVYVRLARKTIETYINEEKIISLYSDLSDIAPDGLPTELTEKQAGTFVSIHKDGKLRGCIGTIAPTKYCVAEEIIGNAISASTKDPRFPAIGKKELPRLEITVDVLGPTERIDSPDELDVKRYGVIVTKRHRRGLLLPNLEGVDTVEEQLRIAKQKAGLDPDEDHVTLERFEVVRHF